VAIFRKLHSCRRTSPVLVLCVSEKLEHNGDAMGLLTYDRGIEADSSVDSKTQRRVQAFL
jgi:hypothetical protein